MSLYYEAATVLANPDKTGGSLKARIYKQKDLKSSPAQLFALIAEASKWSLVLKDVIEKSGLLVEEKKLTPILGLLLTHDLLLAKNGVAANANHVLKLAISRHKARLNAEFTKIRIRFGHATLPEFRQAVNNGELEVQEGQVPVASRHPRWVRINTLKTELADQISTTFAGYKKADSLAEILSSPASTKMYFIDEHIPNLLAVPPKVDLSKSPAYASGKIIFQDKASCFPAYLLDPSIEDGDIVDGCAAPGNKTTHLAAAVGSLVQDIPNVEPQKVIAFERDSGRTKILEKMVHLASADKIVSIKGAKDFLSAKPMAQQYANVGAILLDPSCSGSGIVGRDDHIKIHLPETVAGLKGSTGAHKGKKRKRDNKTNEASQATTTLSLEMEDSVAEETPVEDKLAERLTALSTFQLHILKHAMLFRSARKITYSTCSIHFQENEGVVVQALLSPVAKERGWRMLKREDQVDGMRNWTRRGVWDEDKLESDINVDPEKKQEILDACIRCEKGTGDGTMGFFVAAFVRDGTAIPASDNLADYTLEPPQKNDEEEEDEWNGFSDGEDAVKETAQNTVLEMTTKSTTTIKQKKKRKVNK
ncbi:S-adenosyl-L-methionine-dependent methyltransferase [Dendryphion nanum]|uniref:S-adenosyl-L-methionine-dependent methyltransferase n=1 Tax=Dendryphion nanum TaxID=256645 RepID=A0A9P9E0J3_9PLEO|nr:S-adenosyl-L-methionine-dependent methyltransferase [Dendryphion nanum]